MKKQPTTVQNILLRHVNVIKRVTQVVMVGSLWISAHAVAKDAVPFDSSSIETVSIYHSEMVTHERLPENYSDMISSLAEKSAENNIISEWNDELDSLALLEDDWDGENSAAVQAGAVKNCRDIIEATRFAASRLEEIYPTPFGSLCMEWSMPDGYVNAEIATSGMAFFHHYNNGKNNYICQFRNLSDEIVDDLRSHISILP